MALTPSTIHGGHPGWRGAPVATTMAANTGCDLKGIRDRALLLVGFAGAFRRSELVALDLEDITETSDGLKITIRHSKTDQEGAGHVIAIPRGKIACPVAALNEWIGAAAIASGAIFRTMMGEFAGSMGAGSGLATVRGASARMAMLASGVLAGIADALRAQTEAKGGK